MLAVADLTVHYGRIPAVREICLDVREGEIVSVVGPNGAGKTTMLAAVAGLVPASSGRVDFEGWSVLGQPPERIVRRGIALVPEGRRIFGTLTVAENLQIGATARRDRAAVQGDLKGILERFPVLGTLYKSSAAKLSGGEQQQLAIARALLSRPRLLLLDEPSLGLAPKIVDLVFEVLRDLCAGGVTVLLVEQNAARAIQLGDRSYVLRGGVVALEGSREELLKDPNLATSYLGA